MTLHVIGFVHTRFDDQAFSHCAFTAKVVRWVEMMSGIVEDDEIYVYWGGDTHVNSKGVDRFISLMSDAEQRELFGNDLPGSIMKLDWDMNAPSWKILNHRAAAALHTNHKPGDIVCLLSGRNHDVLINEFPQATFVEPWVGYEGVSGLTKGRAFESTAWRHFIYGCTGIMDGNPFDTVIPNFLRPEDFTVDDDHGYLLYIGRLTARKGISTAVEVARQAGRTLVIAGQGGAVDGDNLLIDDVGAVVDTTGVDIDYRGVVGPAVRMELYSQATATLCPTHYIEPFGTVHAEAMMSGVWPIATDWGVYADTLPPVLRLSTVDDIPRALQFAEEHRGEGVRKQAIERYSMDVCGQQFLSWFERIRSR